MRECLLMKTIRYDRADGALFLSSPDPTGPLGLSWLHLLAAAPGPTRLWMKKLLSRVREEIGIHCVG